LVGVGGGDVVGEFDEVGEAVAGERGEVVASDGGGVVWRGLVGRWLAAFAGSSIANPDDTGRHPVVTTTSTTPGDDSRPRTATNSPASARSAVADAPAE